MEAEVAAPTKTQEEIAEKIRYLLTEYPVISQSMLQYGLGPTTKAETWRPVLDDLIEKGEVVSWVDERVSPAGRHQALRKLALAPVKELYANFMDELAKVLA